MDASKTQPSSSLQNAVSTVEALSVEEQKLLIQIIQEKLQYQGEQVQPDIRHSKGFKAYLASKQKRSEVYKNLAES